MNKYTELLSATDKVMSILRADGQSQYMQQLSSCIESLQEMSNPEAEERAVQTIAEYMGVRVLGDVIPNGVTPVEWGNLLREVTRAADRLFPEKTKARKNSAVRYRGGL